MIEPITKIIEYNGPTEFSRAQLLRQSNLFKERSALFYTPTSSIPKRWVGSGTLDLVLPIPTPSYYELTELRGYRAPRLWVDLMQRASGKLRWTVVQDPVVTIIRYDSVMLPDYSVVGAKALLDALKVKTSGRKDGFALHYFGAIVDDSPRDLIDYVFKQVLISDPAKARTAVRVTAKSRLNESK